MLIHLGAEKFVKGFRHLIAADIGDDVARVAVADHLVRAEPERARGRNRDEHHRGEDADVRKADRVLLHAVQHAGYADEVLRLVVIVLVAAQELQNGDAAGRKEQVGAEDDEQHGNEKGEDREPRLLRGEDRQRIAAAEARRAENRHKDLGLRLALADVPALQQLDRLRAPDAENVREVDQKADDAEQEQRLHDAAGGDVKAERHLEADEVRNEQVDQPVEQHAGADAARQDDERGDQRFQTDHTGDVPLVHAEHVVKAEFLFALLHQEAVRVKQEDDGEDHDDDDAEVQHRTRGLAHVRVNREGVQDIVDGGGQDAGQHIRHIAAPVLFDVLPRQTHVERVHSGAPFRPLRRLYRPRRSHRSHRTFRTFRSPSS